MLHKLKSALEDLYNNKQGAICNNVWPAFPRKDSQHSPFLDPYSGRLSNITAINIISTPLTLH